MLKEMTGDRAELRAGCHIKSTQNNNNKEFLEAKNLIVEMKRSVRGREGKE